MAELRDIPTEEAPDIDEIERQLYARIQLGRDWIGFLQYERGSWSSRSCRCSTRLPSLCRRESKTRADIVAAVRAGQEEIEEAFRLDRREWELTLETFAPTGTLMKAPRKSRRCRRGSTPRLKKSNVIGAEL